MIRAGKIVDKNGKDVYLPNIGRLAIPISLIHGSENGLFLPQGTEKTFKLLCEKNDPRFYTRIVFPKYAHMDCFIGKNASRDIYPTVMLELEKFN